MKFRQVHLDFHTSEKIDGIGADFSKENFQEALKRGHVDSITIFSKCHHGWSYHPTKVNEMHPGLKFDLFGAQLEAAHEIGVNAVAYISATLDEKYAVTHRGEVVRNRDESTTWVPDFMTPGFHRICLNTPYIDLLMAQIRETLENYDADGLFLDITGVQPCYCEACMRDMEKLGLNPENEKDVTDFAERIIKKYMRLTRETVDSVRPGLPVFHNGGHIRRGRRDLAMFNSHLELESLPTGEWGYDHFPVSAAYARTLGMEFLGMTGKFHTMWGEFGGFKHPNALRYEAALSAANGGGCSVGDQLHPRGRMDFATYDLIGAAYKEIEEKEEFLKNAVNVADIGVFGTEAYENYMRDSVFSTVAATRVNTEDAGCVRILSEGKFLFNYVDAEEDFSKYKLIILTDNIILDGMLAEKLRVFTSGGGKVLASGASATDDRGNFRLDFGCEYNGKSGFNPTYAKPAFKLKNLGDTSFVMYEDAHLIHNVKGKVLVWRENPYFNRTREHFSSHQHAPNDYSKSEPAAVWGADGAYIGWNIFREYAQTGSLYAKEITTEIINMLLGREKSVETNLPAQGQIYVTKQRDKKTVHLLYASPVKRGNGIEVIEDIIPLHNISVEVKHDSDVNRVYLAPQNKDIHYEMNGNFVKFKVDCFENHQMIVIE